MPDLDLEPAAREAARLLDSISNEQLGDPTPCPEISVATLLNHFMGLSLAVVWAAQKSTPESERGAPRARAAHLDPHWRTELPRLLDALVEAWRDPAAWEGYAEAGGVTMPSAVLGAVALDEIVMHGWDLARATGQSYECEPTTTDVIFEFTAAAARPENLAGRDGIFGPVVDVPADASAFDRALGFAGRDPSWVRPGG